MTREQRFSVLVAMTAFLVPLWSACGGGHNETGPDSTLTPVESLSPAAEAADGVGFTEMLRSIDRQLAARSSSALTSRFRTTEYTCKPEDFPPKLDTPQCSAVGQTFQSFVLTRWRSEGGLVPVDTVLQLMTALEGNVDASKMDAYGEGRLRVYAFDASRSSAVITAITKCLPNFSCPNGSMRVAVVPRFEFDGTRWVIPGMMTVYVLAEEFLDPSNEARNVLPNWQRLT
jgi:hypothetical protein